MVFVKINRGNAYDTLTQCLCNHPTAAGGDGGDDFIRRSWGGPESQNECIGCL